MINWIPVESSLDCFIMFCFISRFRITFIKLTGTNPIPEMIHAVVEASSFRHVSFMVLENYSNHVNSKGMLLQYYNCSKWKKMQNQLVQKILEKYP